MRTQDNHPTKESPHQISFDISEWMDRGLSWSDYLSMSTRNVARMKSIFAEISIRPEDAGFFQERGVTRILCISEDWCPDCSQNTPLLVRLTEAIPDCSIQLFFRDRNEGLMNHYLTDGKKIIPTVVFFDRELNEIGRWAGPSRNAKAWTRETLVRGRILKDIPKEELEHFDILYDQEFLSRFIYDSLQELKASFP